MTSGVSVGVYRDDGVWAADKALEVYEAWREAETDGLALPMYLRVVGDVVAEMDSQSRCAAYVMASAVHARILSLAEDPNDPGVVEAGIAAFVQWLGERPDT